MRTAILLSGGQDSIAVASYKRPELAITVDYGQVCALAEIEAATAVAAALGMRHRVVQIDCSLLGSGDLAAKAPSHVATTSDWWPFRNQLLITIAAALALSEGISKLLIASVLTDGTHADGRPEFFRSMRDLLSLQEGHLILEAPALAMTTPELIRESKVPMELLAWAHSCHTNNFACGVCRGCTKHREVYRALGATEY